MTERPLSPHCKIFLDRLEQGVSPKRIQVNNLGVNEGCVVDISHPASVEGTSIKIDERGRPFGEVMVPHCRNVSGTTDNMYLLTVGMELCSGDSRKGVKGCEIDQVHFMLGINRVTVLLARHMFISVVMILINILTKGIA